MRKVIEIRDYHPKNRPIVINAGPAVVFILPAVKIERPKPAQRRRVPVELARSLRAKMDRLRELEQQRGD